MKRFIALIIALVMACPLAFASVPAAEKATNIMISASAYEMNGEAENVAQLTDRQRNVLMAFGVPREKLDDITYDEIRDVLDKGKIVKPQYISAYIPSEHELNQDYAYYLNELEKVSEDLNISGRKLEEFLNRNQLTLHDINTRDAQSVASIRNAIYSFDNANRSVRLVNSLNSNYVHFFRNGTTPNLDYAYSDFYIHRDCLYSPYSAQATSAHYTEMRSKIAVTKLLGNNLFHTTLTSPSQYSYNLWGDVLSSSIGSGNLSTHQGIDFTRYEGANVYTVAPGRIIGVTDQFGGKTIALYNEELNVTFIYMHTKNPNVSVGDVIIDRCIAEQGRYTSESADNTHLHFEVCDGMVYTGSATGNETIRTLNPYNYGLYFSD